VELEPNLAAMSSITKEGTCRAQLKEISSHKASSTQSDLFTTLGMSELMIMSHVGNLDIRVDSDEYKKGTGFYLLECMYSHLLNAQV